MWTIKNKIRFISSKIFQIESDSRLVVINNFVAIFNLSVSQIDFHEIRIFINRSIDLFTALL